MSPGTIREYHRMRKADFQELMDVKIADITQELRPKNRTEHSWDYIRGIEAGTPRICLKYHSPQEIRPKLYVPSDTEIQRLIVYVSGTEMELPILLAAFEPMRRGEICALDSDHVKGNVVHVEKNMVLDSNNQWVIKQPKSYAGNRYMIPVQNSLKKHCHFNKTCLNVRSANYCS